MKLKGFYIKTNVICAIPLLKRLSLITFHLRSKTAQIQNRCSFQSAKFVIAASHRSSLNPPSTLSADQFSFFFVDKIKCLRSKLS